DEEFKKVVSQIAQAFDKPEFRNSRYELAIAIARTSTKIEGGYQDVLTWARQLGSPSTFFSRINRPGSANDDARAFVSTLRANLTACGAQDADLSVCIILQRFQIFVFDFTAVGSSARLLEHERAARALAGGEVNRASELWKMLTDLALQIGIAGGDRNR